MTAPHQRARTGGDLRVLRAAVFTAVCVVLAAAGHAIVSCAAVPLWSLGAGFLAVFAVAAPLAGRERSLPGIAVLLTVGQTALHTLFGLGQHGTAAATTSTSADASLVARAARLVCGASVATLSPAQAQRILADARLDTGGTTGAGTPTPCTNRRAPCVGRHRNSDVGAAVAVHAPRPRSRGRRHRMAAAPRGHRATAPPAALGARSGRRGARLPTRRPGARTRPAGGSPGHLPGGSARTAGHGYVPPAPRTTSLQHSVVRRGPPAGEVLVLAA